MADVVSVHDIAAKYRLPIDWIREQAKHPRGGDGWQDRASSDPDEIGRQLDGSPDSNIGYELADALADADFDATESARAAAVLMPPTGLVGGRPSAPSSHW